MTFSHRNRLRWLRRLALGLAVAAVVAPAAQAMPVGGGAQAAAARQAAIAAASTVQLPTLEELRKFSFVPESAPAPAPIERPAPGLGVSACAPGCYYPPRTTVTTVTIPAAPAISKDAPRTAPDAAVRPIAVSDPGIDWRTVGAGIGAGIAGLILVASAMAARRRRTTAVGF